MFWFKGCPKCGGDLHQDRDMYGPYVACLNCGYYLTDRQTAQIILHSALSRTPKTPLPLPSRS